MYSGGCNFFLILKIDQSEVTKSRMFNMSLKLGSGYFAVDGNLPSETILP